MTKTSILHGKIVADSIKEKLSHEIADLLNRNIIPKYKNLDINVRCEILENY